MQSLSSRLFYRLKMWPERDTNKCFDKDITEYLDKYQNKCINKYKNKLNNKQTTRVKTSTKAK